jgi:predicted SAM-dependent methyltransferase
LPKKSFSPIKSTESGQAACKIKIRGQGYYSSQARMKIIVGANGTTQSGWLSLERSRLDLRDRHTWARLFRPGSIEAVLTEHVLEHLTPEEAGRAARNVHEFLRPEGYWRIAVPDANNPSKWYQLCSRPGSLLHLIANVLYTPGEPFHKVFYKHCSLTSLLTGAGFVPRLLEWYDEEGRFHRENWSHSDGEVRRSFGHPYVTNGQGLGGVYNTSLIVDAIKT